MNEFTSITRKESYCNPLPFKGAESYSDPVRRVRVGATLSPPDSNTPATTRMPRSYCSTRLNCRIRGCTTVSSTIGHIYRGIMPFWLQYRAPHLGNNFRCAFDARKLCDHADVLLRLQQHVLVEQEQDVIRVCIRRLPPFQDMVEPRTVLAPVVGEIQYESNNWAIRSQDGISKYYS